MTKIVSRFPEVAAKGSKAFKTHVKISTPYTAPSCAIWTSFRKKQEIVVAFANSIFLRLSSSVKAY